MYSRAGKNRFARPIRIDSPEIDLPERIEWVVFDLVQFDYTIQISNITMFGNCQPIS